MLLTKASAEVVYSWDPLAKRGTLDLYVPLKPQNLPAALLMMYLPSWQLAFPSTFFRGSSFFGYICSWLVAPAPI